MSVLLEVTLIVVLISIAVGLVPLLVQLRGTAQKLEVFLLSSQRDLAQIADDVHASRLRVERLTESLQSSVDELASFAQVLGDVGCSIKSLHARAHQVFESASRQVGGLLGGISTVLALFKSTPTPHTSETRS
jgi:uncharacterized protein YoxC